MITSVLRWESLDYVVTCKKNMIAGNTDKKRDWSLMFLT